MTVVENLKNNHQPVAQLPDISTSSSDKHKEAAVVNRVSVQQQ